MAQVQNMKSKHELAHSWLSWLIIGSQLAQYIADF